MKARGRIINLLRDRAGLYEPYTVYATTQERTRSIERVMPYRVMIEVQHVSLGGVFKWLDHERGLCAGRDYAYSNRHYGGDGWGLQPIYFRNEKEAIYCKMFWC